MRLFKRRCSDPCPRLVSLSPLRPDHEDSIIIDIKSQNNSSLSKDKDSAPSNSSNDAGPVTGPTKTASNNDASQNSSGTKTGLLAPVRRAPLPPPLPVVSSSSNVRNL